MSKLQINHHKFNKLDIRRVLICRYLWVKYNWFVIQTVTANDTSGMNYYDLDTQTYLKDTFRPNRVIVLFIIRPLIKNHAPNVPTWQQNSQSMVQKAAISNHCLQWSITENTPGINGMQKPALCFKASDRALYKFRRKTSIHGSPKKNPRKRHNTT